MSIVNKIIGRINVYLNQWASKTVWFNSTMQFEGCKAIRTISSFNNEIANLGSSSGFYAFNYDAVGVKGINLAIPRQSLLADKEILRNYFSYLKEGAVVLIPLCLFSSLEGEECYFPDCYYMLLQSESIPNYSWKRKLFVQRIYNNPFKFFPLYSLAYELLRPLKPKKKFLSEEQMEADAKRWIRDWKSEFCITDFNRPLSLVNKDSFESALNLLKEIIEFCHNRHLKPVIIFPPISKQLSEKVDDTMRKLLITDFVGQIGWAKAPFMNYIDDEEFRDEKMFRNAFFLNEDGAVAFTKRVVADLKKEGYLSQTI